jgi:hypothetical protein
MGGHEDVVGEVKVHVPVVVTIAAPIPPVGP